MKLKTFAAWGGKLRGRRVLLRVDFNVPVKNGRVLEEARLVASLPTINALRERGAKVIVATHLGRPQGRKVASLSLKPVASHLARLLKAPVAFSPEIVGPKTEAASARLRPGGVLMLENLRFDPGEEKNDPRFAKRLAGLADFYVDDAFASAHRPAASISGVPRYLPRAAGLLLLKEVEVLSKLLGKPKRPFLVVIGGAKVETKIGVIRTFARRATAVALGGSLVAPFLKAKGFSVGVSPASAADLAAAKRALGAKNILLPVDVVVAAGPKAKPRVADVADIRSKEVIYDIGPETIRAYAGLVKQARTLVWNGPLGWFEKPCYSHGTKALCLIIAARSRGRAYGVVGGGETIQAVRERGLADWFDWVSTGGGAMLEFLEGKKLPGLEVLRNK
jgi:phosphoglycerate kinase